ncbi:MAG: hypothetical protein J0H19_19325 [Rhodospirillales bacterium]|nr:hypothetical protein [Rhodospirillales bacterium]
MTRSSRRLAIPFGLATLFGAGLMVPFGGFGIATAAAQTVQSPQARPPVPAVPPPSVQPGPTTTPPEKVAPRGQGTLSDHLSDTHGTLKPPPVDPGITRQPPSTAGTMPVIPPPGTADGKSNVVPK